MSKSEDRFCFIIDGQEPGHCGPTSLAACMGLLGIHVNQRELAKAVGKPWRTYKEGLDEHELRRAARGYGVRCDLLQIARKDGAATFIRRLRSQVARGRPAVLLVNDFAHWVAVLGCDDGRFLVMDPSADAAFGIWSEAYLLKQAWCEDDTYSMYFAIVTSRSDGKSAAWTTSKSFLRLCTRGSAETLRDMTADLKEVALRACPTSCSSRRGDRLADVLEWNRDRILDSVSYWVNSTHFSGVTSSDIRSLFRDFMVVSEAARIRLSAKADQSLVVAQITTLLTTYAWTGTL